MNGALTRAVIAWEIKMDKAEANSVFQRIIDQYPSFLEAHFKYWEFLLKIGEVSQMEEVSYTMLQEAEHTSVPTGEWMKAHTLRAKTLIMLGKHDEAIQVLKRQISVIPPLPIPGLSYFKDGEIVNIEESKNPFDVANDTEHSQEASSVVEDGYKFSVGKTSQPSQKKRKARIEHQPSSFRGLNPGLNNSRSSESSRFSFAINDARATGHGHTRSNIPRNIEPLEVPEEMHYEIENFSVSTDVDFLYQIGKICAESGIKTEEGIRSLNDYCLILDYFQQDMDQDTYLKMKTQARFYIGVCYFRQKNMDATELVLRPTLLSLETLETKEGLRYKETEKILRKCFVQRLMYEVEVFEDYFYPRE